MIEPLQLTIHLLQGRIKNLTLDDNIPIIKRDYPYDHTPCITIENSGGTATLQKQYTHQPTEQLVDTLRATVNIHIWADHEDERQYIIKQIETLFNQLQTDHHTLCLNYHDGQCNTIQSNCPVTDKSNMNSRSVKGQCPDPERYQYRNLFTQYNILRDTFSVEPAFDNDELTTNQPVLHSIIQATMAYKHIYNIGGKISESIHSQFL